MPADECAECRNLLLQAGQAILEHLRAVSGLEEAVIRTAGEDVGALNEKVLDTGIARENAVRAYNEHRAGHATKARTAAS